MTTLIIFLTIIISILCFNNRRLFDKLDLKPYYVVRRKQWYRIITHGFVHGDWMHLIVNMIVFWSFAKYVEHMFVVQHQAGMSTDPNLKFILLYFGGMIIAAIYDIVKYKDSPYYASVGASGAVSAIVFTSIFYAPMSKILLMGIIPLPAIIFGLLYLAFEIYSAKKGGDNINHNAHIIGAIYGFLFPMLTGGFSQIRFFFNGF